MASRSGLEFGVIRSLAVSTSGRRTARCNLASIPHVIQASKNSPNRRENSSAKEKSPVKEVRWQGTRCRRKVREKCRNVFGPQIAANCVEFAPEDQAIAQRKRVETD